MLTPAVSRAEPCPSPLAVVPATASAPAVPPLSLRSAESGATTVVTVGGEIDLATGPVLARYLDGALARPDCSEVIVDLAAVGFLGARGVRVLGDAHERAGARGCSVLLVAGTRAVTRVLRLTGLDRHVATIPTITDR